MRAGTLWSVTHQRPLDSTLLLLLAPARRRVSCRQTLVCCLLYLMLFFSCSSGQNNCLFVSDLHYSTYKIYNKIYNKIWNSVCFFFPPEGSSLLGLSHISVNASMTINDTALTNGTISHLEAPDPIDSLDLTVCPADDALDGCKVRKWPPFLFKYQIVY